MAAAQNDECLIIQLDTPGGLLESTKEIVERLLRLEGADRGLCRAVGRERGQRGSFHHAGGGRGGDGAEYAASARRIRWRSAAAARDESTNDMMRQKLENYASSFIETIADKRHRNVEWAKSAVVESTATTAEKALQLKVIDLIATNVPDLLKQLDGRVGGRQNPAHRRTPKSWKFR